jgi:putative ABC transport system substrate-binding protein
MRRREFLGAFGSAVTVWPLAASAQRAALPVVGFLHASAPETRMHLVEAFQKGLAEAGYVEGRSVAIEYRWSHDDPRRLQDNIADLVRRQVAVIVTPVGTQAAVAAKNATMTIPVVFSVGTDAVKAGLIASYNRPGGNVTGIAAMVSELGAKRLELLRDLLPQINRIGLLVDRSNPVAADTNTKDVLGAASTTGLEVDVVNASTSPEIDAAFSILAENKANALIISPTPLMNARRIQIATLAARYVLPTIYPLRDFTAAGGLMSYGPDDAARYRLVGVYTGRVLKGERPADMPVQRPTAFQLVINMQTARALGIAVPPTLLARADEVIE